MGEGDENELRLRWERVCGGAGSEEVRGEIFEMLAAAYAGRDRYYHGIGHIRECLRELDSVRDSADDPRALELAIWFHDVVYDGRRKDNEERSAELADVQLN